MCCADDATTETPSNRNIPLPIQREVRQRCGFGCVLCGLPLYEYEHMLGWAEVRRHVADELTLLCDQHHREKTSGLLPAGEVTRANAHPFNVREGTSKPYALHYSGSECEAIVGRNRFTTSDGGDGTQIAPIVIDDFPLLAFVLQDGHLLLHLNLFDENNILVLRIVNNQLVYSTSPWDIRLVGRSLEIREGAGRFLIDISFEVPNRIVVRRGRFLRNGVEIVIRPDFALITNDGTLLSGLNVVNCAAGLLIGPSREQVSAMYRRPDVSRYSAARREESVARAEAKMRERKSTRATTDE